MKKARHKLILFSVILITVFFANEGRNFMFDCENIQILLNLEHKADPEVTHHHSGIGFGSDENWIADCRSDFSCADSGIISFHCSPETPLYDFSNSVWQPPKSV